MRRGYSEKNMDKINIKYTRKSMLGVYDRLSGKVITRRMSTNPKSTRKRGLNVRRAGIFRRRP